jgi:hypothetical protein
MPFEVDERASGSYRHGSSFCSLAMTTAVRPWPRTAAANRSPGAEIATMRVSRPGRTQVSNIGPPTARVLVRAAVSLPPEPRSHPPTRRPDEHERRPDHAFDHTLGDIRREYKGCSPMRSCEPDARDATYRRRGQPAERNRRRARRSHDIDQRARTDAVIRFVSSAIEISEVCVSSAIDPSSMTSPGRRTPARRRSCARRGRSIPTSARVLGR